MIGTNKVATPNGAVVVFDLDGKILQTIDGIDRPNNVGDPNRHDPVAVIEPGADATDGIEATSTPLGARFPHGLLVTMNSGAKNFLYFAWNPVSSR